jgi:hypothetical protein
MQAKHESAALIDVACNLSLPSIWFWYHDFKFGIVVTCTLLSITAREKREGEGEARECDNDANDDSRVQYSTS